ncbi:MAG: nucleotidyltransferase domain-containing protein [Lachnospiraceae bacterium]|nr:nucleotidyltransferase domain-containing protein [Lachnospiraceae bacterium]
MCDFLQEREYDFLRTDKHLGDNIILLGYGGSLAYGTNISTSDIDLRGIAVRTADEICLGEDFEEVLGTETDTVVYSFDKMISLLSMCNPNTIEIMGLRPQDYLKISPVGQELLDRKSIFLSKMCIKTFGGYATSQLYRLRQKTLAALTPEEWNGHIAKVIAGMSEHLEKSWGITGVKVKQAGGGLFADIEAMQDVPIESFYGIANEIGNVIKEYNKNSTRNNKAIEHGKINKHAMHLLRLYIMVCDILEKGEIITYREDEHSLLMDIRNGKYTGEDGLIGQGFFDILSEYEDRFEQACKNTKLPDEPDHAAIDAFRLKVNRDIVLKG